MGFVDVVRQKVNGRYGSFVVISLLLFCAFSVTLLQFAGDYSLPEGNTLSADIWNSLTLVTDWDTFSSRAWTAATYAYFDHQYLSVIASVFWIALFGYFIELEEKPGFIFGLFSITAIIAALFMVLVGEILQETHTYSGARIPIMSLAAMLLAGNFKSKKLRLSDKVDVPLTWMLVFYFIVSIADMIYTYSLVTISGYLISFIIGWILGKKIKPLYNWFNIEPFGFLRGG